MTYTALCINDKECSLEAKVLDRKEEGEGTETTKGNKQRKQMNRK
jgi:hypothetical protein